MFAKTFASIAIHALLASALLAGLSQAHTILQGAANMADTARDALATPVPMTADAARDAAVLALRAARLTQSVTSEASTLSLDASTVASN